MNGLSSSIKNWPYFFAKPRLRLSSSALSINRTGGGGIFVDAIFTGICDRHDDDRLDQLLANQALRGFIHAPFDSGKGGRRIKNILAIVQIEDRVPPPPQSQSPVAGRQVDQNVAPVAQNAGLELRMRLNNAGQRVFIFHRTADLIGEKNRMRNQQSLAC